MTPQRVGVQRGRGGGGPRLSWTDFGRCECVHKGTVVGDGLTWGRDVRGSVSSRDLPHLSCIPLSCDRALTPMDPNLRSKRGVMDSLNSVDWWGGPCDRNRRHWIPNHS